MHLVMYDAEYRQIKSVMEKHCGQEGYKVIAVNEGGIESILRIKEVLDRKSTSASRATASSRAARR